MADPVFFFGLGPGWRTIVRIGAFVRGTLQGG
jgi:hypothetical protein